MENQNISLTLIIPPADRPVEVELDNENTPNEIIHNLISEDILRSDEQGYGLAIKGGNQLINDTPIKDQGVKNNDTIRILLNTDAGTML